MRQTYIVLKNSRVQGKFCLYVSCLFWVGDTVRDQRWVRGIVGTETLRDVPLIGLEDSVGQGGENPNVTQYGLREDGREDGDLERNERIKGKRIRRIHEVKG